MRSLGKSRRLTKGKKETPSRIYRAYTSETEYDWSMACSLEEAKIMFKEKFPEKEYTKIKLWC